MRYEIPRRREFVAYWWFVSWDCLSLGLHFCWSKPNLEIHLPFGFIRIGWHTYFSPGYPPTMVTPTWVIPENQRCRKPFGLGPRHW